MILSVKYYKMLLMNCKELELQQLEIGRNDELLSLEDVSTVEILKLKLVQFKCVIDGRRPTPKVCHIYRPLHDRYHDQKLVDEIIDFSQATEIQLSLTDKECGEAESLYQFKGMFQKMLNLENLEIRRFFQGNVNQIFPLPHK